jgi:hypothetical protein
MSYYNVYKKEELECAYCKMIINLWHINYHLKHSKRCIKLKELYLEANPNIKEAEFLLFINDLKKQLKYSSNNNNISNDE